MDRCIDDLSDTRYDRHHGDIQIASGDRKYIVAADRHQTVGKLHDKTCGSEADNIFCPPSAVTDLFSGQKTDFQFGLFPQKIQDKRCGKNL